MKKASNAKAAKQQTATPPPPDVAPAKRTVETVMAEVIASHAEAHFTQSDRALLRQYAALQIELDRLLDEAAGQPATVEGAHGGIATNPIWTTIGRVQKSVTSMGSALRIVPNARTRPGRSALPAPEQPRAISPQAATRARLGLLRGGRRNAE